MTTTIKGAPPKLLPPAPAPKPGDGPPARPEAARARKPDRFVELNVAHLRESSYNPRRTRDANALAELTASIKAKGVIVPLIVRTLGDGQVYEIVAGARRYQAAARAGLGVVPVIVRDLDDTEALEVSVIDNLQREGVHPMEEADGYRALLSRGGTVEDLAERVGKSRSYIYQRLQLAKLVDAAATAFLAGKIEASHAVLLARLDAKTQRDALAFVLSASTWIGNSQVHHAVPVRALVRWIAENVYADLGAAPWDLKDATLDQTAGACIGCPKSSGTAPELFADLGSAAKKTCLDRVCHRRKLLAWAEAERERRKAKGERVVFLASDTWTPTSAGWPKGTLGSNTKRAKDTIEGRSLKKCTAPAKAIVLDGDRPGAVVDVCTSSACTVHYYRSVASPATPEARKRQAIRQEREKVAADLALKVKLELVRRMIEKTHDVPRAAVERIVDAELAYSDAPDPEVFTARIVGAEVHRALTGKHTPQAMATLHNKVLARLLLLCVVHEDAVGQAYGGQRDVVDALARRFKLDPKRVEREIKLANLKAAKATAAVDDEKKRGRA